MQDLMPDGTKFYTEDQNNVILLAFQQDLSKYNCSNLLALERTWYKIVQKRSLIQ